MTYTLVLLRHGESVWNAENLFTGWVDVDLSDRGRAEAVRAGTLLKEAGVLPDVLHTSLLRRAITTANLALDEADRHWIPVRRDWRLNERHYGALQGKDKKADPRAVRRGAVHALAPLATTPRRRRSSPATSSARPATRATPTWARPLPRPSASRTSSSALLPYWHDGDRAGPAHRQDRPAWPPTATPAGPGQAPRRHQRRRHRRPEHPHRHPAGLPPGRATCSRCTAAASTSTPRRPRTRSPPSPTRAAEPGRR